MNGRSTAPRWLSETSKPFLGAGDRGDGRVLADHVLFHDGGFFRLAGHLVVLFQRHDQHGVGVFAELHQIGHAADDRAVGGFAEGGLVDRAVVEQRSGRRRSSVRGGPRARSASGQPSFCDCSTRRAWSRRPIRPPRRLPVIGAVGLEARSRRRRPARPGRPTIWQMVRSSRTKKLPSPICASAAAG